MPEDSQQVTVDTLRASALKYGATDIEAVQKEEEFKQEQENRSFFQKLKEKVFHRVSHRGEAEPTTEKTLGDLLNESTISPFSSDVESLQEKRDQYHGDARSESRDEIRRKIVEIRQQQARGIELQNIFFKKIEESPDVTYEKLLSLFQGNNLTREEQQILKHAHEAFSLRRRRVKFVIETAEKKLAIRGDKTIDDSRSVAELHLLGAEIFKKIANVRPIGEVNLILSPFAVVLEINDERDLDAMDRKGTDGSGGVYIDKMQIGGVSDVPLILIKKIKRDSKEVILAVQSQDHEETHGHNAAIIDALKKSGDQQVYWGNVLSEQKVSTLQIRKEIDLELEEYTKQTSGKYSADVRRDQKQIEGEKLLKSLRATIAKKLPQYISRAKDEVIADFRPTGSLSHLEHLRLPEISVVTKEVAQTQKLSSYDYLDFIGLTPKKFTSDQNLVDIYNTLIREYNSILEENVKPIEQVVNVRQRFSIGNQEEIVAFMRQNPLNTWKQRSEKFFKEEKHLSELMTIADRYVEEMKRLSTRMTNVQNSFKASKEDVWLSSHRITVTSEEDNLQAEALLKRIETILETYIGSEISYSKEKVEHLNELELQQKLSLLASEISILEEINKRTTTEEKTQIQGIVDSHPVTEFWKSGSTEFLDEHTAEHDKVITALRSLGEKLVQKTNVFDKDITVTQLIDAINSGEEIPPKILLSNQKLIGFLSEKLANKYKQRKAFSSQIYQMIEKLSASHSKVIDLRGQKLDEHYGNQRFQHLNENIAERWYIDLLEEIQRKLSGDGDTISIDALTQYKAELSSDLSRLRSMDDEIVLDIQTFLSSQAA